MNQPGRSASSAGAINSALLRISLLGAVLFSFESWAFGPYSWIYGYGAGLETLPIHLALSFGDRHFSLWAPFVAGGVDRLSFWGNADPLNIEPLLIHFLPVWLANGSHRFLQYFLAIYFTARVCQEQLHLEHSWACLAGFLHACFGYFTFGDMLAFPGVPLLVWLLGKLREPGSSLTLGIVAGAAFSVGTSFTHSDPYLLLFAIGWTVIVWRDLSRHAITRIAAFFVGLIVIDSPQLVAAWVNAPLSHRSALPSESLKMSFDGLFYRQLHFDFFNQDPLTKAITMNLPGIALLVGVSHAIICLRTEKQKVVAANFLAVALLYVLLSQRWAFVGAQLIASEFLPWVKGIFMGRFFTLPAAFLISVFMTLAVRLAWDRLRTVSVGRISTKVICVSFVAFMALWPKIALFPIVAIDDLGEKNFSIGSLEEFRRTDAELFRVASVLPLQPSYAYAQGLEGADGWVNLYPAVYRELWLKILAPLFAEVPKARTIFDPDHGRPQDNYLFLGADLVHPDFGRLPGEDVDEAMRSGFEIERRFNLVLLGLLNVKYLLSELPLRAKHLALVHAPAEAAPFALSRDWATGKVTVRYRSANKPVNASWFEKLKTDLRMSWNRRRKGQDIYIYRLETHLPRFRFAERVVVTSTSADALAILETMAAEELRRTAVFQENDALPLESMRSFAGGRVHIEHSVPDVVVLRAQVDGPAVLLVGNTWNPFWTAEVNGQKQRVLRANHAQMAVMLRAGASRVVLRYEPPYSVRGLIRRIEGS